MSYRPEVRLCILKSSYLAGTLGGSYGSHWHRDPGGYPRHRKGLCPRHTTVHRFRRCALGAGEQSSLGERAAVLQGRRPRLRW